MNKPIKYEKERSEGDIFFIPLFLPDWSVRKRDDLLNYGAVLDSLPKPKEKDAGTFSVSSKSKKAIKEFAEAFKAACDRYNAE
jgi:hypothetical protein